MILSSHFLSRLSFYPEKAHLESNQKGLFQKNKDNPPICLTPISLPYTDPQGRILQLWRCESILIAAMISTDSTLKVFSGRKIHNALLPLETDDVLLARIERVSLRKWQIAYIEGKEELYVWPDLVGAGKKTIEGMRASFREIINHFAEHKRDPHTHAQAAGLEKRGVVVCQKPNGDPFQHGPEVEGYRKSCWKAFVDCRDRSRNLQEQLSDPHKQKISDPEPGQRKNIIDRDTARKRVETYRDIQQEARQLLSRRDMRDITFPLNRQPLRQRDPRDEREPQHIDKAKDAALRAAWRKREYGCIDILVSGLDRVRALYPKDPGKESFKESLQQTRLTDSYNAGNPRNPVPAKGGSGGSIGGVANQVGIIKGLFDTAEGLAEDRHFFFIPSPSGKPPFTDSELQQILRELAVGIYLHGTVPFFSLHFNADSNLYPVIHPAYQNTLVGQVISLLDYYMKGFLNGAYFDEKFITEWQKSKTQDVSKLKAHCKDLHKICKEHLGQEYFSISELIDRAESFDEISDIVSTSLESSILSDYSGFRSSFRIIAKQNSFKKSGALFELDGGFDVFYTIEPDPVYEEELRKYRLKFGKDPKGYKRLVMAYEAMKHQIETMMPRLPDFFSLFEKLKIVNFITYEAFAKLAKKRGNFFPKRFPPRFFTSFVKFLRNFRGIFLKKAIL